MPKQCRIGFLLLLVMSVFLWHSTPTADANPIFWTDAPGGGIFSLNSTVMMPEAFVDVALNPTRINKTAFFHNTTVYGNYTLKSDESINASIAFAYPAEWNREDWSGYGPLQPYQNSMCIFSD